MTFPVKLVSSVTNIFGEKKKKGEDLHTKDDAIAPRKFSERLVVYPEEKVFRMNCLNNRTIFGGDIICQ